MQFLLRCLTSTAAFFARTSIPDRRVYNLIALTLLSQYGALHAEAATPLHHTNVLVVSNGTDE